MVVSAAKSTRLALYLSARAENVYVPQPVDLHDWQPPRERLRGCAGEPSSPERLRIERFREAVGHGAPRRKARTVRTLGKGERPGAEVSLWAVS